MRRLNTAAWSAALLRRDGRPLMALCGNPAAGKTILFHWLTGPYRHTDSRAGKILGGAFGSFDCRGRLYTLVDTPGAYSLYAGSAEEEAARDFVCFGGAETFLVICDAAGMHRSLGLALEVLEITGRVLVCVDRCEEVRGSGIEVDTAALSRLLGVPVCGISAVSGDGLDRLIEAIDGLQPVPAQSAALAGTVQKALAPLCVYLEGQPLPAAWLARVLAEGDEALCALLAAHLCLDPEADQELKRRTEEVRCALEAAGISRADLGELAAAALKERAERLCNAAVRETGG